MHTLIKQSTAAQKITYGPITNADGTAYVTDNLTYADFTICKNNGSWGAMSSCTIAHVTADVNGNFQLTLATGDIDTIGKLEISLNKATLMGPVKCLTVLVAATFDALVTNAAGAASGLLIAGSNAATTFATLTVTGAVALQSTLTVTGTTTLAALTQVGAVSLGATTVASLAITGALSVGTTTTLTGNVTLGGTLGTGAVTFASVAVTGALSVGTTTTLTGVVSAANASNSIVLGGVVIDGKSWEAAMKIVAAGVAGIISGAGSGTETFLGLDKTTPRIIVSADASGNRTAVTY